MKKYIYNYESFLLYLIILFTLILKIQQNNFNKIEKNIKYIYLYIYFQKYINHQLKMKIEKKN